MNYINLNMQTKDLPNAIISFLNANGVTATYEGVTKKINCVVNGDSFYLETEFANGNTGSTLENYHLFVNSDVGKECVTLIKEVTTADSYLVTQYCVCGRSDGIMQNHVYNLTNMEDKSNILKIERSTSNQIELQKLFKCLGTNSPKIVYDRIFVSPFNKVGQGLTSYSDGVRTFVGCGLNLFLLIS